MHDLMFLCSCYSGDIQEDTVSMSGEEQELTDTAEAGLTSKSNSNSNLISSPKRAASGKEEVSEDRRVTRASSKKEEKRPVRALEASDKLYTVEKILGHQLDKNSGEYSFFIRWEGYGPDLDSWEPLDSLPNDSLYDYIAAKLPRSILTTLLNDGLLTVPKDLINSKAAQPKTKEKEMQPEKKAKELRFGKKEVKKEGKVVAIQQGRSI